MASFFLLLKPYIILNKTKQTYVDNGVAKLLYVAIDRNNNDILKMLENNHLYSTIIDTEMDSKDWLFGLFNIIKKKDINKLFDLSIVCPSDILFFVEYLKYCFFSGEINPWPIALLILLKLNKNCIKNTILIINIDGANNEYNILSIVLSFNGIFNENKSYIAIINYLCKIYYGY